MEPRRLARVVPLLLLLLRLPAAAAFVDPPTNVTLRCRNFRNVLAWTYDQLVPGLRFRVDVQPYYSKAAAAVWAEPPDLHVDLSAFSDHRDYYYVAVAAVDGQNESAPAPPGGVTYSYFMDEPTSQICHLDLPPVNVSALPDDLLTFSFLHPWLFHRDAMPRSKTRRHAYSAARLPPFHYHVRLVDQKHQHHLTCEERVCQHQIPVDGAAAKHCVNISGEMMKVEVRATQLTCALPFDPQPPGAQIS